MSVQPFHALLHSMLSKKAEVLVLSEGATPRIRSGESLTAIRDRPWSAGEAGELLGAILPAQHAREYETAGETAFLHCTPQSGWFSVRVLRTRAGSTIVTKQVREEVPTLDELGLPRTVLQVALRAILRVRGVILVAGAPGSGRSTSLAAMLGFLNREVCGHIVVLEDDPRWLYRSGSCILSQIALRAASASRKATLRSAKGWGADVVAIDCATDVELLAAAIDLAESGMAVIATVGGFNARSALEGIVRHGAAVVPGIAEKLADVLRIVTWQKLVPRQDRDGRVPAVEVVVNDRTVGNSILTCDFDKIREVAEKSSELGMQTIDQSLAHLHLEGVISRADALRCADSTSEAALFIKRGRVRGTAPAERTPRAVFASLMARHGVPRIVLWNGTIEKEGEDPFAAGASCYRTPYGAERNLTLRRYVEIEASEIPALRGALAAMGIVEVLHGGTRQTTGGEPTRVVRVVLRADATPLDEEEFSQAIKDRRMLDVTIERSIFGDPIVRFSVLTMNEIRVGGGSMRFLFDPPCHLDDDEVSVASAYGCLQSAAEMLDVFREHFTRPLMPSDRDRLLGDAEPARPAVGLHLCSGADDPAAGEPSLPIV